MIELLYVNGCSWTAGDGIQHDPSLNSFPQIERYSHIKTNTWGRVLADKLGASMFVNDAIGGGSNKRMLRTTCDFLRTLDPSKYETTMVVIGWSTVDRNEIFLEEDGKADWYRFNATQTVASHNPPFSKGYIKEVDQYRELYIKNVFNFKANYVNFFQEMYLLSNLLENLKIKYLFPSSLPWRNCWTYDAGVNIQEMFQKEINAVKKPCILSTRDCEDYKNVMSEFCRINRLPMAPDHHTMIEGHKKWGEHLHSEIKEIYKL